MRRRRRAVSAGPAGQRGRAWTTCRAATPVPLPDPVPNVVVTSVASWAHKSAADTCESTEHHRYTTSPLDCSDFHAEICKSGDFFPPTPFMQKNSARDFFYLLASLSHRELPPQKIWQICKCLLHKDYGKTCKCLSACAFHTNLQDCSFLSVRLFFTGETAK